MNHRNNEHHEGQYKDHSHHDEQNNRNSEGFQEGHMEEDENRYYEDINLDEKFNKGEDYDCNGVPKDESKADEFTNEIIYYELMKLHSQAKEEGLTILGDSDKLIEEQYFQHLEEAGPIQDPKSNNLILLKEMMSKRQHK